MTYLAFNINYYHLYSVHIHKLAMNYCDEFALALKFMG